jgi:hypothetical protein
MLEGKGWGAGRWKSRTIKEMLPFLPTRSPSPRVPQGEKGNRGRGRLSLALYAPPHPLVAPRGSLKKSPPELPPNMVQ